MRNSLLKMLVFIIGLIIFSTNSFGQSPGDFNVENNTDCNIEVRVYYYLGGSCMAIQCNDEEGSFTGTANANTTTLIHDGSGLTGNWGKVIMTTGSNREESGPCSTSSDDGCDCASADIEIIMDTCIKGIISLES